MDDEYASALRWHEKQARLMLIYASGEVDVPELPKLDARVNDRLPF